MSACDADEDTNSVGKMNQETKAPGKKPVTTELGDAQPGSYEDPHALAEGEFESPMPVLESVDEVLLSPEEEENAKAKAEEKQTYTKKPGKPKSATQKE